METVTLRCSACGAPLPAGAAQCPYCQAQVASVACPKCFGMVPVSARNCPHCGTAIATEEHGPSGLGCPECRQPLSRTTVGDVALSQCARCGGVWLHRELFERIAQDREERGEVLGTLPGGGPRGAVAAEAIHYRPCPECGRLMNRTNYGRISGVILDTCKEHGLWFDQDELRRVLEFIEKGGLDKAREKQIQELEDRKRLAAASQPLPGAAMEDPRLFQEPRLFDLVDLLGGFMNLLRK
jgi:Zn-finger nucleic acid-binding protein/RNA polymerase subunit RPABC4/transcription elongation factor Spt4